MYVSMSRRLSSTSLVSSHKVDDEYLGMIGVKRALDFNKLTILFCHTWVSFSHHGPCSVIECHMLKLTLSTTFSFLQQLLDYEQSFRMIST